MHPLIGLLLFLAIVAIVAASGAFAGPGEWYANLAKPSWTPPGWLFGPVWSLLYICIAFAGWLLWRSTGAITTALAVWAIQLALNAAWSFLFFRIHSPAAALVDLIAMWIAIGVLIAMTTRVSTLAAALLVPYWIWVTFAGALNFAIWRMNRA